MEAAASGAGQDGARMVGCPTRPIAGGRPWPRSFSSTVPGMAAGATSGGGAAVAPGRARGLYADFDRPRRARSSAEPRDRSRHARSGHRWCHPLRGIVGRCAVWRRSYGGMVITGVAKQIAAKIRSLVYLDAFVPENGKSLFDYLPAEQSGQMRDDAAQNGEGYKITPIPAVAFAVNAEDAAWVERCASSGRWRHSSEARSQWPAGSEARVHACLRLGAVAVPAIGRAFKDDRGWRSSASPAATTGVQRPRSLRPRSSPPLREARARCLVATRIGGGARCFFHARCSRGARSP